jgi:hypothetical protein
MKVPLTPRQVGLVFDVPRALDTLSWRRRAQWSVYPDDHVGRPLGTAKAFPGTPVLATASPHVRPTWPWCDDCTPMGSNDFRATRCNVLNAALTASGIGSLRVLSDGRQHVRAWVDGDTIHLLVADLTNEGCPACFNEFAMPRPTLAPGSELKGTIHVAVLGPNVAPPNHERP